MYRIIPDEAVFAQVAALRPDALVEYAQVLDVLHLSPWSGEPQHEDNPDAAVRRFHFGPGHAGQVVYLILEERREVHLLLVQWLG